MIGNALRLAPDTRVIYPTCEQEFPLEQGFAEQAPEAVAAASAIRGLLRPPPDPAVRRLT